jgi:hypothetical protein
MNSGRKARKKIDSLGLRPFLRNPLAAIFMNPCGQHCCCIQGRQFPFFVFSLLSFLLSSNAQFPHPGAQGAGVETQEECRSVFPLDAPSGLLQHLADMIVFQLGEGFDFPAFNPTDELICPLDRLEAVQDLE